MPQAAIGNGLSFDPFSFCQNLRRPPEVDVCGGEIVDALVVAAVIVVGDESRDLGFEIARQIVVFQQDSVLKGSDASARSCPGSSDDKARHERV